MKRYRMVIVWSVLLLSTLMSGFYNVGWSINRNGYFASLFMLAGLMLLIEVGLIIWQRIMFGKSGEPQRGYTRKIKQDVQYIPHETNLE